MTLPRRVRCSFTYVFPRTSAHAVGEWRAVKYIFIFYQNDIKYFSKFCEAMEVDENNKTAPAAGWGLDHAYKAWGKFWNETFYPHGDYLTLL